MTPSLAQLLAAFALAVVPASAGLKTDIEFAHPGNVSLTLDAYVPDGKGPFPTVIIVHGGGFVRGDKQMYVKPLFPVFTEVGFTWFTINYRLAPDYRFPAPVQDVETAVQWVRQHAAEYKVDMGRIALIGESAGGHLVSYVGAIAGKKLGLAAVVPFYAPHDLAGRARRQGKPAETVAQFLGIRQNLEGPAMHAMKTASPISHLNRGMPPFLLIHGTDDKLVDYSQSVEMQRKMQSLGLTCDLYTVKGGAHGMSNWASLDNGLDYQKYLVNWLKEKFH